MSRLKAITTPSDICRCALGNLGKDRHTLPHEAWQLEAPAYHISSERFPVNCLFFSLGADIVVPISRQYLIMGIIKNKYINKFISGGNTPAFPPSHIPGEPVAIELPPQAQSLAFSHARLPPGWFIQWEPNAQKIYYLEQASGRTQWVPPVMSNAPPEQCTSDDGYAASILSGTTAHPTEPGQPSHRAVQWHGLPQHDRVRRSHIWMNLPTKAEREKIMREAAEKREKEGPPKYVSHLSICLSRTLMCSPGQKISQERLGAKSMRQLSLACVAAVLVLPEGGVPVT